MGYPKRECRNSKFPAVPEIDCGADCAKIDNKGDNDRDKGDISFGEYIHVRFL